MEGMHDSPPADQEDGQGETQKSPACALYYGVNGGEFHILLAEIVHYEKARLPPGPARHIPSHILYPPNDQLGSHRRLYYLSQ